MKNTTKNDKKEKLCVNVIKSYKKQTISDKKRQNGSEKKYPYSDREIARTWGLKQNTYFYSAVTACNTGRKKFHWHFAKKSCEKRKKTTFSVKKAAQKSCFNTNCPAQICL